MSQPLPVAILECRLDAAALGLRIARYQRLAANVRRIEYNPGLARVQFDEHVPDCLLQHS